MNQQIKQIQLSKKFIVKAVPKEAYTYKLLDKIR